MSIIIAALTFITIVLTIMSASIVVNRQKNYINNRLKLYTTFYSQLDPDAVDRNKEKLKLKDMLSILGKVFAPKGYARKVEMELIKAEIPMRGEEYLALTIILSLFLGFIGFVLLGGLPSAVILFVMTILASYIFVNRKKSIRLHKLNAQISDCITVISNSLRAGYSFMQAIDLVGKEMSGPLAVEFRRAVREINFGTTIEDALTNLNNRVESDDLELMITAVLIQRQIGGNLAEILDNISYTIRERIRIKGEIKTLTSQGKISGLIIGFMPPGLFVVLMLINPDYMSILLERQAGWFILGGGLLSELLGVLIIKKIIDIEV